MTQSNWRTPLAVLICGGIILTLSLGTRHSFGLYLQPMTLDLGWDRQTFAIALAIQNLVYGLATPFAGMIADKYGAPRALIGLFNIFGTYLWGWLGNRYTKKYVLSVLYFTRAVVITIFIAMPITAFSVYLFSATIGFLWLGTVPVTSGLIAQVFGVKYLSTLTGIAFLFHQVGSFIGVWIAGYLFDTTGSYQLMWLFTIAMGVVAALINMPINEHPIVRPALRPA